MDHTRHSALIDELGRIVREEPAPGQHPWPHIQECWVLIKQIGPAFKDTQYPHPKAREAAWSRFQQAVSSLKEFQTLCENRSAETRTRVLDLLKKAHPESDKAFSQARALGDSLHSVGDAPFQRKQRLDGHDKAHAEALNLFNDSKWQFTPAHYKACSDKLNETKQQLRDAWKAFRQDGRAARQAKGKPAPRHTAPASDGIQVALEDERARLDNRRTVLAGLQKILPAISNPVKQKQTLRWCEECRQDIALLEASIAKLEATLPTPAPKPAARPSFRPKPRPEQKPKPKHRRG
jgi:hypothetical protein